MHIKVTVFILDASIYVGRRSLPTLVILPHAPFTLYSTMVVTEIGMGEKEPTVTGELNKVSHGKQSCPLSQPVAYMDH